MCYAIPGKLVSIDKNVGIVDYFGENRRVLLDFSDVKVGDYIYAQGGVCVNKVSESEALKTLDAWKEVFFQLKKTDRRISSPVKVEKKGRVFEIIEKVNRGGKLSDLEALELLEESGSEETDLICAAANSIRQRITGNSSCIHGIIEFSNHCTSSCHYCGIRKEKNISRYRMTVQEIEDAAFNAMKKHGFRAFVLQSGEDEYYTPEMLSPVIKRIRNAGALVFFSPGTRTEGFYEKLYLAGARAALLRFETYNSNLFEKLRPGTVFSERISRIKFIKKAGFVTATGFLCGLPGETKEDVLKNIHLTGSLNPDMVSFGPAVPSPDTPIEKIRPASETEILKTIALTRILYPRSNILITSAMESLYPSMPGSGLKAGGNSLMIDVTPRKYRKKYSIYPGKEVSGSNIEGVIKEKTSLLYSFGRAPTDLGI